jgi:hypothetical protein
MPTHLFDAEFCPNIAEDQCVSSAKTIRSASGSHPVNLEFSRHFYRSYGVFPRERETEREREKGRQRERERERETERERERETEREKGDI